MPSCYGDLLVDFQESMIKHDNAKFHLLVVGGYGSLNYEKFSLMRLIQTLFHKHALQSDYFVDTKIILKRILENI